jgi:eukaryotic-like serine/threonine-protein kinase
MDWQGTLFGGKYLLSKKLGQGGMGSVWKAEHVQLRSPVAIKLIEQSIATNPEALARFLREAQSAASLRSPHVVQILDHGADHGVPYIAMELLDGESLASRLERLRTLSPVATAAIMSQVARAMSKAHEAGIVHRDLKPDNIFLVKNDDEEVAKVLDFGIAKAAGQQLGPSSSTRTGALLGTPYYMSPEQAEGNRLVDFRTDIWALGVIAFECILGRRPFESEAFGSLLLAICTRPLPIPSAFGPVPAGFDAWFGRACARDPDARFPSAREAAADLRRVCAGNAVSAGGLQSVDSYARTATVPTPHPHTPHAHTPGGYPHAHTPGGYPPAPYSGQRVPTGGAQPMTPYPAGPTANPFTASVDPAPFRRSKAPLVVGLSLGVAVLALVAIGIMKLTSDRPTADATAAAAVTAPAPPEPKATVEPAPAPKVEPAAPIAALDVTPTEAPAASASAATVAKTARPVAGRPRPRPTPTPVSPAPRQTAPAVAAPPPPPPAAAPAPPPPRDPAPTKPKINLGI